MITGDTNPAPFRILGFELLPREMQEWNEAVDGAIARSERLTVVSQNLHGLYSISSDTEMQRLHRRSEGRIDGMSMVYLAKLYGYPVRRDHRLTWVDWMLPLMHRAAEQGWKVFYLGSRLGIAERGADVLKGLCPGLQIATHHGFFDMSAGSAENEEIIHKIHAHSTQVLLVGMGMPRQEHWILANRESLQVAAVLTCGTAIEYFADVVATPPRWLGRIGLEWLYRLVREPGRLWRRYLVEPWRVLWLVLRERLRRF